MGRRPRAGRAPVAGRDPRPGHRAGTERLPGVGWVHRGGRAHGPLRGGQSRPRCGVLLGVPTARPRVATGRARPPAGTGIDARAPGRRGLRRLLRRRPGRAPGTGAGRCRGPRDRRRPPDPYLDARDADRDRLPRRPRDDASAEQLGRRRARAPLDPGPVRGSQRGGLWAGRGRRPRVDPPWDRGGEARDGRSGCVPDRPDLRDGARGAAARPLVRGGAGGTHRSPAGEPAGGLDQPDRRRDDLPCRRRRGGQRGQPHRIELPGLRVGRRRPRDRRPLPEPGQLLQPRRASPEPVDAGQADAPHAAPRDAVP